MAFPLHVDLQPMVNKLEWQIALLQEAKHGLIVGLQSLLESYLNGVMIHFMNPDSMSYEVSTEEVRKRDDVV